MIVTHTLCIARHRSKTQRFHLVYQFLTLKHVKARIFFIKTMETKGFLQFKITVNVFIQLFLLHLNRPTYVMSLRRLEIVLRLQCGDRL